MKGEIKLAVKGLYFGCVKSIEQDFLTAYKELHLTLLSQENDDTIMQSYEEMQYFYQRVIKPQQKGL
ncbi:MAG: hypothetical protein Q9M36_14190 [Sulfurovum sp.]|nr:hypothetical protein [Sulfurovum sp.]